MTSNLYRYNGKEEQQIAGTELAVLDYGARTYDPWLSRWTSIAPLAAKYYRPLRMPSVTTRRYVLWIWMERDLPKVLEAIKSLYLPHIILIINLKNLPFRQLHFGIIEKMTALYQKCWYSCRDISFGTKCRWTICGDA